MKTKECCYEDVDRTVLMEMKKIYDLLAEKRRNGVLASVEEYAYFRMKQIYDGAIDRDFCQGDNAFTYVNEMDKQLFQDAISATKKYLEFVSKSDDIESRNLIFRFSRILENSAKLHVDTEPQEYSTGVPIKLEELTPEQRRKAATEFSEGSQAMEDLFNYCFENDFETYASCSGHECKNGAMTMGYIAVKLNGKQDDKKKALVTRVFESKIPIVFIKPRDNSGIIINMLLDPYERENQVLKIKTFLEQSKEEIEPNPVVENVLNYVQNSDISSLSVAKEEEGQIGIEEVGKESGVIRGVFPEEQITELYRTGKIIKLNRNRNFLPSDTTHVNSREVARAVLELTKKLPGKFADSMKRTLSAMKKMLGFAKNFEYR